MDFIDKILFLILTIFIVLNVRWILNLLDKIYKNIYTVFIWLTIGMIFVMLIALSAQYIGDTLSQKILSNRSIELTIVVDNDVNNKNDLEYFFKSFNRDYNLRKANIKIKKKYANDNNILNEEFSILISKNKDLMENLAKNNKFAVLDKNLFANNVKPFVEYSKYDEYAKVTTIYNNIDIYIAIFSSVSSLEKTKIIKTISMLNDVVFRKKYTDLEE